MAWTDPEMGGSGYESPPQESKVPIGFQMNNGTDLLREAIGPQGGSNCFSKEVRTALCEIR